MHQSKKALHPQTGSFFIPVQVREALRRSRVESRDLRASLFRAEDVIKQLTLTKVARQRGAHNSNVVQRDASSPLLSLAAAAAAAANEKERRLVSYLLASSGSGRGGGGGGERGGGTLPANTDSENSKTGMPSRESLLTRVQQLERELLRAGFRTASGPGAAAGHGRRSSAEEVRPFLVWVSSRYSLQLYSRRTRDPRPYGTLWRRCRRRLSRFLRNLLSHSALGTSMLRARVFCVLPTPAGAERQR